ncbi:MAG: TIGR00645 family protein [Gammaproteobacteria bacterium]|nr:MAG: TIGR00645 family protein [Gammaproteobacteria bacterium]
MKNLENLLESLFFSSRWLLAPFFFGLVVAILALLFKFAKGLYLLVQGVLFGGEAQPIIAILSLVDTALLASLLLIIAFSGYENFVSKFAPEDHEDRPGWMGKVGFSDLKLKLIGAIVAISAVELLKAFIESSHLGTQELAWKVGIHLTFVTSGVLFALTDYIAAKGKGGH